jgi:hypothetical protein
MVSMLQPLGEMQQKVADADVGIEWPPGLS